MNDYRMIFLEKYFARKNVYRWKNRSKSRDRIQCQTFTVQGGETEQVISVISHVTKHKY